MTRFPLWLAGVTGRTCCTEGRRGVVVAAASRCWCCCSCCDGVAAGVAVRVGAGVGLGLGVALGVVVVCAWCCCCCCCCGSLLVLLFVLVSVLVLVLLFGGSACPLRIRQRRPTLACVLGHGVHAPHSTCDTLTECAPHAMPKSMFVTP